MTQAANDAHPPAPEFPDDGEYEGIIAGSTHATVMLPGVDPAEQSRDHLLSKWDNPAERPGMVGRAAMFHGRLGFFLATIGEWVRFLASDNSDAAGKRYALADFIIGKDKTFTGERSEAAGRLQAEAMVRMRQLAAALAPLPDPPRIVLTEWAGGSVLVARKAEAPPIQTGALSFDAAFADFLESLGKDASKVAAKACREQARARADKYRTQVDARPELGRVPEKETHTSTLERAAAQAELFALWMPAGKAPGPVWAAWLTDCLWLDWVKPRLEAAVNLSTGIISVRRGGDDYTKMSKLVPPISWAWGAPGVPAKTVVDGDQYAPTPRLFNEAALLPKTWGLLPPDHEKSPHKTALPVDGGGADEGAAEALALSVTGHQGYVMTTAAAKLALLLLSSPQVKSGQLARSTLGELTTLTRRDLPRIRARDHEVTARAFDELRGLFIFLPDGTKVQVFDVQSLQRPEDARADMQLHYGLTGTFVRTLALAETSELMGPRLKGNEYRGEFILNLTGAMRLPNAKPTLLRYYIRLAAHWNAAFKPGPGGGFDPSRMPGRSVEDWAASANALSPSVVDFLKTKKSGGDVTDRRRRLSDERKRALADLEQLADEHHLIRLEKKGDLLTPLPTDAHLEAWGAFRAGGGRTPEE